MSLARRLKLRLHLTPQVKRWLWTAGLTGVILTALTWRFAKLPSGISDTEASTLETVLHAPLRSAQFIAFLPYHLALKIILRVSSTLEVARAFSLAIAVGGLLAFYRLAREWWSHLVAGAATIMLGTSYWFLLLSRLIDPQVLSLFYLPLLILLFLRLKHESKWWQIVVTGFVAGGAVYQPPVMGWVALSLTAMALIHSIRTSRGRILAGWMIFFASFAFALAPLILITLQDSTALAQAFGLVDFQPAAEILGGLVSVVRTALWDGGIVPLLLPHIGLIDFVSLVFVLLGSIRTIATWRVQRSQLIILAAGLSLAVTALSTRQYAALGYFLPVAYLLVARGLNQYISEWRKRFPRNPSARLASLGAIIVLVGFVCVYNLRSYYVAWARSESVQRQFKPQDLLQ